MNSNRTWNRLGLADGDAGGAGFGDVDGDAAVVVRAAAAGDGVDEDPDCAVVWESCEGDDARVVCGCGYRDAGVAELGVCQNAVGLLDVRLALRSLLRGFPGLFTDPGQCSYGSRT